jgi:uncharacterized protein YndB with AHSA1/START domain
MTQTLTHKAEGRTLTLERTFDAPRELVFSMWTDGEKLKQWWIPGPGWTLPVSKMDFREGGTWHYMMKGPDDGSEYANMESWGIMKYLEIDPPKKIVYEDAFSDETGEINPDMPGSRSTLEFFEEDGKTRVVSVTDWADEAALEQVIQMGMIEGVTATYDNLDIALATAQAM